MGAESNISWTDSTINCWLGCSKVDTLCRACYAEVSTPVRVKRAGGLEVWGATAARSETKSWARDLRKWNRAAERLVGEPRIWRVFGQSLSDTFEDYEGGSVRLASGAIAATLDDLRAEFFRVIEECPALTFQLLTKRPENVVRMVPPAWLTSWPAHVQIGTSVGDQETAEKRIPHLLAIPVPVRFLSVEPQIGPVDLAPWLSWDNGNKPPRKCHACNGVGPDGLRCSLCGAQGMASAAIDWVIQGGESGSKARPFDLAWMFDMRDQCAAAGVPWFPKQAGARPVYDGIPVEMSDSHGGDENEWPTALRGRRAFPEARP